jgi:hypothetical protein
VAIKKKNISAIDTDTQCMFVCSVLQVKWHIQ